MYTESEILDISKLQYKNLSTLEEIETEKHKIKLGYVSEINDKTSGEQSYVITDIQLPSHPTPEDLVKNMTIE